MNPIDVNLSGNDFSRGYFNPDVESLKQVYQDLKYGRDNSKGKVSLEDASFLLRKTVDYFTSENPNINPGFFKKVGDCFYNSSLQLKQIGKDWVSRMNARTALKYYKKSSTSLPKSVEDSLINYSYGFKNKIKDNWKTEDINLLSLIETIFNL